MHAEHAVVASFSCFDLLLIPLVFLSAKETPTDLPPAYRMGPLLLFL